MNKAVSKLKKGIDKEYFLEIFSPFYPGFDFDSLFSILKFQGLPLIIYKNKVILKTVLVPYYEYTYCVVDLEVNNSKPNIGQAIEIGAVKIKKGKIIDEFSSLIYAEDVPRYVTKVTGINQNMLQNQKPQKEILEKFRLFLGESVFVAHAADFDFNFLNRQYEKEGLGNLLNRSLCTITLAQKTLKAKRYGLKYLKEELKLPFEESHRALGDAKSTARVFLKALENLPEEIKSTEDLIEFAPPTKNKCLSNIPKC